ncbi:MAG TPA: MFS transporter [Planctomycetota bacterium]|nr:MFS transporter [Planctomycetota bacterium]
MENASKPLKWYQGLEKYCWVVLVISALGWLFDTMDQNLFNLVRKTSMEDLLMPKAERQALTGDAKTKFNDDVSYKGGVVTAIFLLGWATGGFIFGILGDRLGRTQTMIITILIYAVFTGSSGLVHDWGLYAAARFMTGVGVGGEWAAGAALVAETFPQRSRPMALGFLQALSSVGNMMAACITWGIEGAGIQEVQTWRIVYFVGAVPALLVLWIRRSVHEPEKWVQAKEQASVGKELGKIGQMFTHPVLRRNLIASVLMGAAGVGALWGVGFFSTDFILRTLIAAGKRPEEANRIKNIMFILQNLGSFFGIYTFAVLTERFNRRKAFFVSYALAWISVLAFFWSVSKAGSSATVVCLIMAPLMGFFTLMPFSGFTIYFPELFPTRLRTTGCGFAYNAARILAAQAPFAIGFLGKKYGFPMAATIVVSVYILGFIGTALAPETKGLPLPEDKDFETA